MTAMPGSRSPAPTFFVIGHPKCGTTAMYHALRAHPSIFMPKFKEPEFFAEDLRPRFEPPGGGRGPQTLESYLALFSGARPEQVVGEASPGYLRSHVALTRIAEFNPNARLIAILREPASLLNSLYLQARLSHNETAPDLRQALALEPMRRRGEHIPSSAYRPQALLYSEWVAYTAQLRRLYSLFPPEQVLVLVYEEYRGDNASALRQVFRFLGVADTVTVSAPRSNESVHLRSPRLDSFVHDLSLGRGAGLRMVRAGVKAVLPRPWRRRALDLLRRNVIYAEPPVPDPGLMAELRRVLAPEVNELSEYLHRDFVTLWGYPQLDVDSPARDLAAALASTERSGGGA